MDKIDSGKLLICTPLKNSLLTFVFLPPVVAATQQAQTIFSCCRRPLTLAPKTAFFFICNWGRDFKITFSFQPLQKIKLQTPVKNGSNEILTFLQMLCDSFHTSFGK